LIQEKRNIDKETGEILSTLQVEIPDAMNEDGYRIPTNKRGAKLFSDVNFPNEVTDSEIGKMTRLSKLMIGSTNMLGYKTRGSIRAYTDLELAEAVGICGWRGKAFIDKMIQYKMMGRFDITIGKQKRTQYYINPAYFFAGKRIGLDLYLMFQKELDEILPDWVRKNFAHEVREKVKDIGKNLLAERNGVVKD
jgi:hypothetical protein